MEMSAKGVPDLKTLKAVIGWRSIEGLNDIIQKSEVALLKGNFSKEQSQTLRTLIGEARTVRLEMVCSVTEFCRN